MVSFRAILLLGTALGCSAPALADPGMWTFDKLPLEQLSRDHQFTPGPDWADHLRRSSVRLTSGCSGSFISPAGLVLSNHHCARDCTEGLASEGHDLMADGFYAAAAADEKRCPNLEVDQLEGITHVTDQIRAATKGRNGPAFHEAEAAAIAAAEKAATTGDDVRCEVVTLFHGGVYDLYKYCRYQDVRLVFVPEEAAAQFGGSSTRDWPFHALDMSLFRVYDHNLELDSKANYLSFAAKPAAPGALVFVSGNPGDTERLDTVAQLEFQRDVVLPTDMADFSELHGVMLEMSREAPELARQANFLAFVSQLNAYRTTIQHRVLLNTGLLADAIREEAVLRTHVAADPALLAQYGRAWDAIALAVAHQRVIAERWSVLERAPRVSSLMHDTIALVRHAAEASKPDGQRLPEYTDAALPQLRGQVLSPAPIYPEIETRSLAWLLSRLQAHLGEADAAVAGLLGHESPDDLAKRLVSGTKLADVEQRKALFDGGAAAVAASIDPLVAYVRDKWEPMARAVRRDDDDNVEAVITANAALIDQARYAVLGASAAPDATFTPRLSYGVVQGYSLDRAAMPAMTTVGEAFAQDTGHDPFRLPKSWLDAKSGLDGATPLDMATTADIVGGNSGSPMVDRDGKLVGLIFAVNDAGEGGTFRYDDAQVRAIAVAVPAIRMALDKIYHADRIVKEIDR